MAFSTFVYSAEGEHRICLIRSMHIQLPLIWNPDLPIVLQAYHEQYCATFLCYINHTGTSYINLRDKTSYEVLGLSQKELEVIRCQNVISFTNLVFSFMSII